MKNAKYSARICLACFQIMLSNPMMNCGTNFLNTLYKWPDNPIYIGCLMTRMFLVWYSILYFTFSGTGSGSSTGSVSAWIASGPEFDPHVRHILSWRLGHEKEFYGHSPSSAGSRRAVVSYTKLHKECALSTGKLPRRLAQEQCD